MTPNKHTARRGVTRFSHPLPRSPSPANVTYYVTSAGFVNRYGTITLRYDSKLHHIGMGARHRNRPVVMLIADRDIRVVTAEDGELLRHLTLDPSRDYQRQSA